MKYLFFLCLFICGCTVVKPGIKLDGLYINHKRTGNYSVEEYCHAQGRAGLVQENKEVMSKHD
jgi:hypothetical protein